MVESNKHAPLDVIRRRFGDGPVAQLVRRVPRIPATAVRRLRDRVDHADPLQTMRFPNSPTLFDGSKQSPSLPRKPTSLRGLDPRSRGHQQYRDLLERSDTTTPEYFVGVIPEDYESVVDKLEPSALGVSYVSYPKTLPQDGVDCQHRSSWVFRKWTFGHFQLHVDLFELANDDESLIYVFCHHEANWLRHPISHLRTAYLNSAWGRTRTVDLLQESGLPLQTCRELGANCDDRASTFCAVRGERM
jgi:hypothetical protein